jgi:hypothetical protein
VLQSCSSPEVKKEINSNSEQVHPAMDWIIGTWVGGVDGEGLESREVWTKVSEDRYAAEAETRKDGEIVTSEHMEISLLDGHHCLIVEHGDADPVIFDFTFEDEHSFICRNNENDFPKQIEYKTEGEELVAIISDGAPMMEFRFQRE